WAMSRSDSPRPGSALGGASSVLAGSDTEGWLARTLQLLASSRPDSVQQLRELLDQAIGSEQVPGGSAAQQQQQHSVRNSNNGQVVGEPEKKKAKMTNSESRLRLIDVFSGDGGASASGSPDTGSGSLSKSRSRPELSSSDQLSTAPAWQSDPAHCCVKCRSSRGQLVDCFDCKDMYHLDCHNPPVSESEVSDQRSVWYCLRCRRKGRQSAVAADLPVRPPAASSGGSAAAAAASSAAASSGGHKIKAAAAAAGPASELAPAKKRPKRD
ncbi:hypothetical protein BOX15_Mlig025927g2, partial [Macrostomum lignano]